MAVSLITAYPYQLDWLCKVGMSGTTFLRDVLLMLVWFKVGSFTEVYNLPMSLVIRLSKILENEDVQKRFRMYRGDLNVK